MPVIFHLIWIGTAVSLAAALLFGKSASRMDHPSDDEKGGK